MKHREQLGPLSFDEQRALEDLQKLHRDIQRARGDREHAEAEFDSFVRGFRAPDQPASPVVVAREPRPAAPPVVARETRLGSPPGMAAPPGPVTPAPPSRPPAAVAIPPSRVDPALPQRVDPVSPQRVEPASPQRVEPASPQRVEPPPQRVEPPPQVISPPPPDVAPPWPTPPPFVEPSQNHTPPPITIPATLDESRSAVANRKPRVSPALVVTVAAVLLALALVALFNGGDAPESVSDVPAGVAPQPEPQPQAAEPVQPAPAPRPGGVNLEMITRRTVWVRVTVDGRRAIERELPAGERIPLRAEDSIIIRAGDAGAVAVRRGDGAETPLGEDGIVATRTFTAERRSDSAPQR